MFTGGAFSILGLESNAEQDAQDECRLRFAASALLSFSLAAFAMLCAKCHKNEATIHFKTVVNGAEDETVHLCPECAPPTGFNLHKLDLKQIEALSVIGKKCEFCGKDAFSGEMRTKGGAIYWCFDCGLEFVRIVSELMVASFL